MTEKPNEEEIARILNLTFGVAKPICPDYATFFDTYNTYNINIGSDPITELPMMLCDVAEEMTFGYNMNYLFGQIVCVVAPIWMINCLLSLAILSSKQCEEVTFVYHRAINVADSISLLCILEAGMFNIYTDYSTRNYAWLCFHYYVTVHLERVLSVFAETIIAWVAIERALCAYPNLFTLVNRRKVSYSITIGLLILVSILLMPLLFQFYYDFDSGAGNYKVYSTGFGMSYGSALYDKFYFGTTAFRTAVIVAGSLGTVFMLIFVSYRKRRFASTLGTNSTTAVMLRSQAKTTQILCLLQLCEAIPVIVRNTLSIVSQSTTVLIRFSLFIPLSFPDGLDRLRYLSHALRLAFAKKLADLLVHGMHLYLYMGFLKRFRKIAFRTVKLTSESCAQALRRCKVNVLRKLYYVGKVGGGRG